MPTQNLLITCGRFPPATGLTRALKHGDARVDVADSLALAPALHSNATDQVHVLRHDPSSAPLDFSREIARIVSEREIDMVVPAFEEGFFLAHFAHLLPVPMFAPAFETIELLHNKARFATLCQELGLATPETVVASNPAELRAAIPRFDEFVARPAFSRGGAVYLTNHGPRAGETKVEDCRPTPDNPWLVQPYVEGEDACTFSIVRDGKVLVHCTYEPSIASVGGFATQFTSIPDFGTLEMVSKIVAHLNYTGFIGIDYRRTRDGVVMIECNPRSSAGLFLTPPEWIAEAVLGEPGDLRIVEPGHRRQYDTYLLEPHIVKLSMRQRIHELLTTPDAFMTPRDLLPALYAWLNRRHGHAVARREHLDVFEVLIAPVCWNGAPMPAVPPQDGGQAPTTI